MRNVIGVINLGNTRTLLNELTRNRSIASVPFGGRYRFIDFALSNMVNTGIQKVAVFTLNKSRSLLDHLGSGKEWDLDRKQGGLFVLPPAISYTSDVYKGDLQNFYGHIDYFNRSKEQYVIVSSSHMICNIDYKQAMEQHIESGADITVVYKEATDFDEEDLSGGLFFEIDATGRVRKMLEKLNGSRKIYMETFIIEKNLLVSMIEKSIRQEEFSTYNMIRNSLLTLKVMAYEHTGHLAIVNSINSYYKHSMNLLNPEVWRSLFFQPNLIYTKVKDEPPTKYVVDSDVKNSLVANGCIIEGTVENCILFRGVKVRKGAVVRDSIIMQDCEIEEGSQVEGVIFDKEVHISQGKTITGDKLMPSVITKRSLV